MLLLLTTEGFGIPGNEVEWSATTCLVGIVAHVAAGLAGEAVPLQEGVVVATHKGWELTDGRQGVEVVLVPSTVVAQVPPIAFSSCRGYQSY